MGYILLVDDDDDLRDAIHALLADHGYETETARNGADALELLAERDLPDLALIDVFMPVMDGMELIAAMRKSPRFANIPIIVMSAAASVRPPPGTTFLPKGQLRERLLRELERLRAPAIA